MARGPAKALKSTWCWPGESVKISPRRSLNRGCACWGRSPEEELPALYSGAVACLYPSLYEGFGLPVLEAMQCGALVITSRDPAIQEVAGDAAILVEATDVRGLAQAMKRLLSKPRPSRE